LPQSRRLKEVRFTSGTARSNPQRLCDLGSRLSRLDQLTNLGPNGIGNLGAFAGFRSGRSIWAAYAAIVGGSLDCRHEVLEGIEAVGGWKGGQFLSQGLLEAGDHGLCILQLLDA
jgi:hypothetical protein